VRIARQYDSISIALSQR